MKKSERLVIWLIKVAVVGLGTMGQVHLEAWRGIEGVRITAVYGRNQEKAERAAATYLATAYDDFGMLLETADVDLVDICVPTFLHKEYVSKAASYKKQVVCEKPLGRNAEEAKAIYQACKENQVRLFAAHVVRFFPEYQRLHHAIQNGTVGTASLVRASRGGPYPESSTDWYSDVELSGGVTVDLIIHDLDWLLWTFGKVKKVTASENWHTETGRKKAYTIVFLEFENGLIATVEGSWGHYQKFGTQLEITGDEGVVAIGGRTPDEENGQKGVGVALPEIKEEDPYRAQLAHFKDCLITGQPAIISPEEAIEVIELCDAAVRSAKQGCSQQL